MRPFPCALALVFSMSALVTVLAACRGAEAGPGAGKGAGASSAEGADAAEKKAITAAVELYFQGHATGDGNLMRKAFHPESKLFSVKDGQLAQRTAAEFAAGFSGKPEADEAKRVRKILQLDYAGDAAMVKVELRYPAVVFIDYLSLLKIDGRWQIVNKIFHRRQPAAAVPSRP